MSFLSKDNVTYNIQAFLLYLNISGEVKSLESDQVEAFRQRALDILESLMGEKMESIQAAFRFNDLVEEMNQTLKTPYPSLRTETPEGLIKGEIAAFEHYLNQELKAKHLTLTEEASLFNDSLVLWEKVGTSLSAKEGASELAALVEKLNGLLPEKEHYPLPDQNHH